MRTRLSKSSEQYICDAARQFFTLLSSLGVKWSRFKSCQPDIENRPWPVCSSERERERMFELRLRCHRLSQGAGNSFGTRSEAFASGHSMPDKG